MKNYNTTGLRGMIEQMSTEQLDEMLLHELEKESVDESAVRLIMEVLEKRDQNEPVEINPQIAAAWKKYQTHAPVQSCPKFSFRSWPGYSLPWVWCLLWSTVCAAESSLALVRTI